MAIPNIPNSFVAQQANRQVYLTWDIAAGATSYDVQQSLDGVTYASIATPSVNNYLDVAVTVGVQYFYKVASTNGSGTSPYTAPKSVVPTPTAEMSLRELRTRAQNRADRLKSQFVTTAEWNFFINQAMFELYDLLVTASEEYFLAPSLSFQTDGSTFMYDLPDGVNHSAAAPFYKLKGVDLALSTASNGFVTINKFMFQNRNQFVYPNTASTIYGVFNLQYRLMGTKIEFIPTPSASQTIRLWYIPRLNQLLQDSDLTTIGFSGWLQYVIVRAAKYALDKEESDTSTLDTEIVYLKGRIEETSANRDQGQPDRITDIRGQGWWGSNTGGYGGNGPVGGF